VQTQPELQHEQLVNQVRATHHQLEQQIEYLNKIDYLVMIFFNTAVNAESFYNTLSSLGANCVQFHSALSGLDKEENLRSFASGEIPIMVCTDSASRGLDLPAVRVVVQAEFALNVVQHLHRIDRTSLTRCQLVRNVSYQILLHPLHMSLPLWILY